MSFHEACITIPATYDHLVLPLNLSSDIAAIIGFAPDRKNHVRLALEEYLSYILETSQARDNEKLAITFCVSSGALRTEILFSGCPLDPEMQDEVAPAAYLTDAYLSFGPVALRIANSVSSRYFFENKGKEGCMMGFEFDLPDRVLAEQTAPAKKKDQVPLSNEKITEIRLAKPEEALAVCQRIYDCYGHSYVYEDFYLPDRVGRMIEDGRVKSFVALTESKTIAGHLALFYPSDKTDVCEWGMAVVPPEFRKRGLLFQMLSAAVQEVKQSQVKTLYAHAVTEHEYTQRVNAKFQFSTLALMLGYASSSLTFRGIEGATKKRKSTFVEMRLFAADPEPINLYLPVRHAALIEDLYQGLGLNVTAFHNPGYGLADKSEFRLEINSMFNLSNLFVSRAGKDFEQVISDLFRHQWLNKVEVIYIFLNLEDPHIHQSTSILERLGFAVGGIFPFFDMPHALVYQFIADDCVDLQSIHTGSDRAAMILSYVTDEVRRNNST